MANDFAKVVPVPLVDDAIEFCVVPACDDRLVLKRYYGTASGLEEANAACSWINRVASEWAARLDPGKDGEG